MNNKVYRFDLENLENAAVDSYLKYLELDNNDTRTHMFLMVRDLAFAIVSVGHAYTKYTLDYDEIAYEYSLYLFDRIVFKGFRFKIGENGVLPLQKYIALNILHVITTKVNVDNRNKLIGDLEIMDKTCDLSDKIYERRSLIGQLHKGLRLYYNESQIRKYLPIVIGLIEDYGPILKNESIPLELRDFSIVLFSISKRLLYDNNINIYIPINKHKTLSKVVESSISSSLFMYSILNVDKSLQELIVALDIKSLMRLVTISGGKSIKIPNEKDFDVILASVLALGKSIVTGEDPVKFIDAVIRENDLIFNNKTTIESFISKLLESIKLEKNRETDPLSSIISFGIKSIESLTSTLPEIIRNIPPESLVEQYIELNKTLTNLSMSISGIQDSLLDKVKIA